MRIGIISDVHSNLQALEEVVKALKRESPDKVIFLGDAVGYGANPNECCEIIKEIASISLMGNHDSAVLGKTDLDWFNPDARKGVIWTREHISSENLDFLGTFLYLHEEKEFLFSHGSPVKPERFIYVFNTEEAEEIFRWNRKRYTVIFVGHSHITLSFLLKESGEIHPFIEDEIKFSDGTYIINVGSVGQPREGDPRAFFAILDTEKKLYRGFRVEYNIKEAAERILKSGLPPFLAYRLYVGE